MANRILQMARELGVLKHPSQVELERQMGSIVG